MEQIAKNVTGADIARELGVSAMTVSRALNNKAGISIETKHQVTETAKRFGYVQNALGSDLASGSAKAIGCVVPALTDPFVGQVLEGVEEVAQESGYALIMTSSPLEPDRQLSAINTMSATQWKTFTEGAIRIARTVKRETGLRTVLHHHIGTWVETPEETAKFLSRTDPELIGLVFDTGHYRFAGGDPLEGLRRHADRIWYVHFKDHDPQVAEQSRTHGWNGVQAVEYGV